MAPSVVLLAALAAVAGPGDRPRAIRFGGDLARGVLVNLTPGALPDSPADPRRPTVVFIHGVNPAPRMVHFGMAEQFAEALARRGGPAFNTLGWDWNAASFVSFSPRANQQGAIAQGQNLAAALCRMGAAPSRIHLVGHSSGGIVAASAARALAAWRGEFVAQLTLLDPAALYHDVIFDQLAAGSAASLVENYWTPGPSGYGRPAPRAGVWNTRVPGPTPYLGAVWPLRSNHLHIVEWYVSSAGDPAYPGGFNTSLLLREGTR